MLKSRKTTREMERISVIFSEDCGEVLAESLAVRYLVEWGESEAEGGLAIALNSIREGMLLFMTPREFSEFMRRIESEQGRGLRGTGGIDAEG